MKVFQRMEASSQRKRRHFTSEGSADSDTLSPSSFHPLTPSQKVATATQRERRGSTGSARRPPVLPPAKMRLSSVSSNEGVSTADLPDAFSPPVTPRLAAPLASPHPLPSSLPSSPLHTSTYIQSPTVRFTPDLQPQYLLMQFPLPLKKALLRQWEAEKHGIHGDNGGPRPLWPRDDVTQRNGYLSTVWPGGDVLRPRERGSLKHRWMKKYSEEKTENEEKENRSSNSTFSVPLKQRLLHRWQERQTDLSLQTTPIAVPVCNTTTISSSLSSGVDCGLAPSIGLQEREPSPLFEEFSDSEFDSVREDREKEEEEEEEGVAEVTETRFGGTSGNDNPTPRVSDVATPVSRDGEPERGVVDDVIAGVGAGQKGVCDGKEGTVRSETVERTEVVRKMRSLEELMSEDMGRGEGEEGRSGGKSLEELMVMDVAISGGGELGGREG
ncbi:hypothetical protein GBAR_LOCUS5648 [Geodia barretti]|nr:hypothetical protein GBAR_LOCUS5648 [Geodia barretti]